MKIKLSRNQWISICTAGVISLSIGLPAILCGNAFSTPNVIVIHDSFLHDNAFNEQAYLATQEYAENFDKRAGYWDVTPINEKMISSNVNQYFENKTEIVIANNFTLTPWLLDYENNLNDDRHIIITDDGDKLFLGEEHENILSIPFKAHEASFLAGIISSIYVTSTWPNNPLEWKIGAWGAMPSTPIINLLSGYESGIDFFFNNIYVNKPDNEVFQMANPKKGWWSGSFNPDASSEEFTYEAINNDVKVVFPVAGGQAFSAINIFSRRDLEDKKVIGVDIDANKIYDEQQSRTVLTTSTKNVKKALYDSLESYEKYGWKRTKEKEAPLGLDGGYVGVTNTESDSLPSNSWEYLIENNMIKNGYDKYSSLDDLLINLKKDITLGNIHVENNSETFK